MIHLDVSASQRLAVVAITLLFAMHCQASLLDCAAIPGIDQNLQGECVSTGSHVLAPAVAVLPNVESTPPQLLARTGFQMNAPQAASSVPDSLPLMVFFAGLVGVLLIRAKSCNSK